MEVYGWSVWALAVGCLRGFLPIILYILDKKSNKNHYFAITMESSVVMMNEYQRSLLMMMRRTARQNDQLCTEKEREREREVATLPTIPFSSTYL